MKIELNTLISHFSDISFRLQGVYRHTIDPGTSGQQKTYPCPGFIFPLRGQALYHFDGTPYLADVGKVIHGSTNASLDKQVIGNTKWEFISAFYDIQGSEPKGICLPDTHFDLAVGQSPRLMELLQQLWRTYSQPGALPAFQAETLFRRILEEVFVCAHNQTNDDTHALFENVSSYIREHYMEGLTVRNLAEQYGVNENRLFYVFSKYAGMGAGDYLIIHRLNRAKEWLVTTDASIGEVAKSVGYPDALYFSRIFNKQFRLSPSAFRKKFRNNP